MADDKDNKLLNEIKNYLEITWDDSLGDEKIRGMVKRGMAAISGKIGECNFYEETQEKALLFDYVMYARAGEIIGRICRGSVASILKILETAC